MTLIFCSFVPSEYSLGADVTAALYSVVLATRSVQRQTQKSLCCGSSTGCLQLTSPRADLYTVKCIPAAKAQPFQLTWPLAVRKATLREHRFQVTFLQGSPGEWGPLRWSQLCITNCRHQAQLSWRETPRWQLTFDGTKFNIAERWKGRGREWG